MIASHCIIWFFLPFLPDCLQAKIIQLVYLCLQACTVQVYAICSIQMKTITYTYTVVACHVVEVPLYLEGSPLKFLISRQISALSPEISWKTNILKFHNRVVCRNGQAFGTTIFVSFIFDEQTFWNAVLW